MHDPAHRSASTAHPRSRGENGQASAAYFAALGSSPLTRGKPRQDQSSQPNATAHPRSRGENAWIAASLSWSMDSSPLTRGKRRIGLYQGRRVRLIPTHVGKTSQRTRASPPARAHPHSRGENGPTSYAGNITVGSSPLTRGKPRGEGAPCVPEGLIPTHAGKTAETHSSPTATWAHPRSREDNIFIVTPWGQGKGSSLLTRRKRVVVEEPLVGLGLIPAHAGKTDGDVYHCSDHGAHPRSHGENHWRRTTDFALNGSLYSLRNFSFKASKMSSEKALMS